MSNLSADCVPVKEDSPEYVDLVVVQVLLGTLYAVIMLLGVLGNSLVIYSIVYKNMSFNVHNVFILSLAISDLLITLTSLPITAISIFTREWRFGLVICSCVGFVQGSGIFISSFTLMAVAIDRHFAVLYPLQHTMTYTRVRMIVVLIWLLGYALASPLPAYSRLVQYPSAAEETLLCGWYCDEKWPSTIARSVYGFVALFLQYVLPLFVTGYCYALIALRLHRQIRQRYQHENILPETEQRLNERRRKTNRMTMLMVCSFMLAWCPMNVLNMMRDLDIRVIPMKAFSLAFAIAHVLGMTSVLCNPVIYSFCSEPFREMTQRLTTHWCWTKQASKQPKRMTMTAVPTGDTDDEQ